MRKSIKLSSSLAAGIVFAIIIWYFKRPTLPPRPNIILIVADTLRADHMGCYGYSKGTTPNLDAFARDCYIFEQAYAPIPSTLPSHISLFTGLYPDVHGLKYGDSGALSTDIPTVGEKLNKIGYYNAGIVSNIFLKKEYGFGRGFNIYKRILEELTYADRINKEALPYIEQLSQLTNSPFFLFFHYYDPHSDFHRAENNQLPYYAPEPFLSTFCKNPGLSLASRQEGGGFATQYLCELNEENSVVPEPVRDSIIQLYDAGIAYFDSYLGELLSNLKEKNLYTNSMIIFTADHGEQFQEHGEFIHNQVYQEDVRVPLLIKFPGERKSRRIESPVALIDILPTLLDYLEMPVDNYLQGVSLLPLLNSQAIAERGLLSQQKAPRNNQIYALVEGRYKLILDLNTGEKELYDLLADPLEKDNRAGQMITIVNRLEEKLKKQLDYNLELKTVFKEGRKNSLLNMQEIDSLKSLGYLGH
jgi:arylsulfatase A-like enzyme